MLGGECVCYFAKSGVPLLVAWQSWVVEALSNWQGWMAERGKMQSSAGRSLHLFLLPFSGVLLWPAGISLNFPTAASEFYLHLMREAQVMGESLLQL